MHPISRPRLRRSVPPLVWIVLAALSARAALAVAAWLVSRDPAVFTAPDTDTYVAPARELLRLGTFTVRGEPELIRTPGYPLLLLPGLLVGALVPVTVALQIALSAATVAGVYALGGEVGGDRRAGLAAAAIYAVEPLSMEYASLLLSETLFTALAVWALWLAARHARHGRPGALMGAAAVLAAAVYVRPAGYLLPFAMAGVFAARALLARRRPAAVQALAAAGVAAAILAPWHLRNAAAAGYPGFSSVGTLGLYFYSAAGVLARQNGVPLPIQQARMGWPDEAAYLRAHPEQRDWPPARRLRYQEREAKRIISGNLPEYARLHARGAASVALGTGAGELRALLGVPAAEATIAQRLAQRRARPVDVFPDLALAGFLLALYALGAFWVAATRRRWNVLTLLFGGFAAYLVLVPGPVGGARFRHPVMPVVAVAAGAGAIEVLRRKGSPSAWVPASIPDQPEEVDRGRSKEGTH